MPILVVAAACAVAAALPVLWWAMAGSHKTVRAASRDLLGVSDAPTDLREAMLTLSANDRAVQPLMGALASQVRRLSPLAWVDALERRLITAGRPAAWPLERVLAGKMLLGVAGLIVGFIAFGNQRTGRGFVLWLFLTVLGYFAPDLLLYSRAKERQKTVQQELADTLDQMTVAVEAGLGFEAAMARAGRTGTGPLADELVRTMQEVQVGVGRSDALRNLADRTDVADLRQFVLAIVQAEGYGIPIADVLKVQAAEVRTKRRQRAEERAMKIPVKVLFPLVLCIFPTIFIVILGPAVIQIANTLFGAGGAL